MSMRGFNKTTSQLMTYQFNDQVIKLGMKHIKQNKKSNQLVLTLKKWIFLNPKTQRIIQFKWTFQYLFMNKWISY